VATEIQNAHVISESQTVEAFNNEIPGYRTQYRRLKISSAKIRKNTVSGF